MTLVQDLSCFSGLLFLLYGTLCLCSLSMVEDFHRFGLDWLRLPTGVLEVLGGAGLLVGLHWTPVLWVSSGGLSLLMLIAFAVRMRMRDNVLASMPSFLLMLLNAFILIRSVRA